MSYCSVCGQKLITKKPNPVDPKAPFCPQCQAFRFPMFNNAISVILLNPERNKVLFIQQYGKPFNVLVAGYINKGENAIETLKREVKEEVNLNVVDYYFNDSKYFEPSNTLMTNFIAITDSEDFSIAEDEVDQACWYPLSEAEKEIKPGSLAKQFLLTALPKIKKHI